MSQLIINGDSHSKDRIDIIAELAAVQEQYKQLELKHTSLKKHTSLLAALGNTTSEMMKQESLDKLLQFIANEIVNLTSANGAYMHMTHETDDRLIVVATCGELGEQPIGTTLKRGFGLSSLAWDTGRYQYTDSFNENYNQVAVFPEGLKAAAIPLAFSGKISGVIFVTSSITENLVSQIPLLQEIARIASLVIFYTEQLESQSKELQRTKALSTLGSTLYQSTEWDVILHSVSTHLFEIFDIHCVSVYQESPRDGKLTTHTRHNKADNGIATTSYSAESLSEDSISNWCFKNNMFAQVNRHVKDTRESSQVHQYRDENNIGSTMCIPITYQEKPWGVFLIYKK